MVLLDPFKIKPSNIANHHCPLLGQIELGFALTSHLNC